MTHGRRAVGRLLRRLRVLVLALPRRAGVSSEHRRRGATIRVVRGCLLVGVVAASARSRWRASAEARTPGFPLGVAAGEITPTSAKLWARAPRGRAPSTVEVGAPGARNPLRDDARAAAADDLTVRGSVTGSATGDARTVPLLAGHGARARRQRSDRAAPTADVPVRFAITGDADATPNPNGKPGFNRFETYAPHGEGAQRLQHQPRRHDLLRHRARRRAGRADVAGEGAEVPARARAPGAPAAAGSHRSLHPLGRPRVHQRLLPRRARRDDLRRRA